MKHVVAAADEIPPGQRKIVDIEGRSIGVFNIDGQYFALLNRCPHQGGALCEGKLWGSLVASKPGDFAYDATKEILTCPWHGWEFHVRTGRSWCEPKRLRVRTYDVSVETYPVEVREENVIVDVPTQRQPAAQRQQE